MSNIQHPDKRHIELIDVELAESREELLKLKQTLLSEQEKVKGHLEKEEFEAKQKGIPLDSGWRHRAKKSNKLRNEIIIRVDQRLKEFKKKEHYDYRFNQQFVVQARKHLPSEVFEIIKRFAEEKITL